MPTIKPNWMMIVALARKLGEAPIVAPTFSIIAFTANQLELQRTCEKTMMGNIFFETFVKIDINDC